VPAQKHVSYEITISDKSFETIAKAIFRLSIKKGCFVKLKDVVEYAFEHGAQNDDQAIYAFERNLPVEGETRLFLRVNSSLSKRIEYLKTILGEKLEHACAVREAIVFCAFWVSANA